MDLATVVFLAFIIAQRLGELALARRNTALLLRRGAYEVGRAHYPVIVAMHTAWILCLVVLGYSNQISPFWLAMFAVLQLLRVWILKSLGPRWTTRVIVLDEPLVKKGPFRYIRHPNYWLVCAEIIVAPMVLGLASIAVIFTFLNAAVLWVRIGVENEALAHLRKD